MGLEPYQRTAAAIAVVPTLRAPDGTEVPFILTVAACITARSTLA